MYFFQSRNQSEQQQQALGTQKPTTILRRIDMMTIRVMPENRIVDKHQAAAKDSIISTIRWAALSECEGESSSSSEFEFEFTNKRYLYRLG